MNRNFRINDQIAVDQVYLIDASGRPLGAVSRDQALYLAYNQGLDLVEVGPRAFPPVVKIIDFGKFLYQQHKKERKQQARSKSGEVKQIRLSVSIDDHDLATKAKHGREFLKEGHKVRVSIVLRGRQRILASRAIETIGRFAQLVDGQLEVPPRVMGNMIIGVVGKN